MAPTALGAREGAKMGARVGIAGATVGLAWPLTVGEKEGDRVGVTGGALGEPFFVGLEVVGTGVGFFEG